MRVFTTHPSGNQRNWHNLGIGGRMLGAATSQNIKWTVSGPEQYNNTNILLSIDIK